MTIHSAHLSDGFPSMTARLHGLLRRVGAAYRIETRRMTPVPACGSSIRPLASQRALLRR